MNEAIKKAAERIRAFMQAPVLAHLERPTFARPSAAEQVALMLHYRALASAGGPLPSLRDVGFTSHSQVDEDGILLYLLSLLGAESRRCAEIAAGDGIECNTANLILNHRWEGLLVDASARLVERGRSYFARHPLSYVHPPRFVPTCLPIRSTNSSPRQVGVGRSTCSRSTSTRTTTGSSRPSPLSSRASS